LALQYYLVICYNAASLRKLRSPAMGSVIFNSFNPACFHACITDLPTIIVVDRDHMAMGFSACFSIKALAGQYPESL